MGGGLSKGFGIFETAVKEANEEANVPEDISIKHLKSAGWSIFSKIFLSTKN